MLLPNGLLPGIVFVESEFQVAGAFATCGPNSLGMGESYGAQVYVSTASVYQRMRKAGRADAGGASNMSGLEAQAKADGFRTLRAGSSGWKAFVIARLKEGAPVIIEPSKGQVLRDLITGQGMDASNLQYHFNLAVGYWPGGHNDKAGKDLPEGFWMADGDNNATNPVVNGKRTRVVNGRNVQFYSAANLAASAPYAVMAVYPKVQIGGPALLTAPDAKYKGWRYDSQANKLYGPSAGDPATATSYFERGFAGHVWAEILAGRWDPNQEPLGREFVVTWVEEANHDWGDGSIILLRVGYLAWSRPKNTIYTPWSGQELRRFRQLLNLPYQAA